MTDTWTKKSSSGKSMWFWIEGNKEGGFLCAAKVEGREIAMTVIPGSVPTRENVEAIFGDYIAGKELAKT